MFTVDFQLYGHIFNFSFTKIVQTCPVHSKEFFFCVSKRCGFSATPIICYNFNFSRFLSLEASCTILSDLSLKTNLSRLYIFFLVALAASKDTFHCRLMSCTWLMGLLEIYNRKNSRPRRCGGDTF